MFLCYHVVMSTRTVSFVESEFYHVYNRGTDKRVLFQDVSDYDRFQTLLYLANSNVLVDVRSLKRQYDSMFEYVKESELVAIGAYCLMPNHFHILLTPLVTGGVTKFMSKLMTGYSMYFNKKYMRTGTLYEGPFKAKHADYDEYLKYLYAYIHLNPLKLMSESKGAETAESVFSFLKQYQYSSFCDYLGNEREVGKLLNPAPFPAYFATASQHLTELQSWLSFREEQD